MRIYSVILCVLITCCNSQEEDVAGSKATSEKAVVEFHKTAEIIDALKKPDRKCVKIALRVLNNDNIKVTSMQKIDFSKSYSDNKFHIQSVINYLEGLSEEELSGLDKKMRYFWDISSPSIDTKWH